MSLKPRPNSRNGAVCKVHFYNVWQGLTAWDLHNNHYVCVSISPKVDPRMQLRLFMNAMDIVSVIILTFVLNEFNRYFTSTRRIRQNAIL